ncbi:hypothetical protein DXG01_009404 [Tephrocybe rancida]|nr:hypothetical protein DXG01_009404 [Tephrocybe rancida]
MVVLKTPPHLDHLELRRTVNPSNCSLFTMQILPLSHWGSIPPLRMRILPTLPRPTPPHSLTLDLAPSSSLPTVDGEGSAVPTDDLLLLADTSAYPTSTSFVFPTPMSLLSAVPSTNITNLLPPSQSTSTAAATTGFLPTSNALQNELTTPLANMATQLRRNAQHFSEMLGRDQVVADELQEKLPDG